MSMTEQMSQVESRCDISNVTTSVTRPATRGSHMESHVPRPDQTRPEVLYLTRSVCIGHLFLQRHLGDATASKAGAGQW